MNRRVNWETMEEIKRVVIELFSILQRYRVTVDPLGRSTPSYTSPNYYKCREISPPIGILLSIEEQRTIDEHLGEEI